MHTHRGRSPYLMPVVLLALVQTFGTTLVAMGQRDSRPLDLIAYGLLLAGPAALGLRRWSAPVALVGAAAATMAYFIMGYPGGPGFLAALVAVFVAVKQGHRLFTWLVVVAGYLTYALAWRLWPDAARPSLARLVTLAAWLLVAFAVAEANRVRTAHFAEMARSRAEHQRAAAEQERAEAELRRRQASEERLRVARELHDVLGHHLSLINVQAGVGLHLMDDRPEQARAALTAIKQASAEALTEVRAVLSALRPDDESPPRAPAQVSPELPDGLRALVAEVGAAGLRVELRTSGETRPLPAEVSRAAYRIVQEALTNVRRHAGEAAAARVRLAYGHDDVVVYVSDNGAGAADTAAGSGISGNGIDGMRQRAEALGGELRVGPAPDGGFEVYARLPAPDGEEDR